MKKLVFLFTVCLLALPAFAGEGWYAGVGGGVMVPLNDGTTAKLGNNGADFDVGGGVIGSVGYKYGNGFRSEFEAGYRGVVSEKNPGSFIGRTGRESVFSFMANGLYDVVTGGPITPYIGAGVGAADVRYHHVDVFNDDDTGIALQGIAGLSAAIPGIEQLKFFTQYEYQNVFNVRVRSSTGIVNSSDYGSHLIVAGVRWDFDSAPKAAPVEPVKLPAKAPEPEKKEVMAEPAVQKYMVFFDFDRSDITIEAADILKKVADNAKAGKISRLVLTGHADRAGSDKYNMKLSERRADSVKKYLVRLGLPAGDISTAAKGESEPLVATKDGVREPQNRRVEIVSGK